MNGKKEIFFEHPRINVLGLEPVNGFSMDFRTAKKDVMFEAGKHYHKYFEIEVYCSGQGIHLSNSKSVHIREQYVSISTRRDYHTFAFNNDEAVSLYNVAFMENNISPEVLAKIHSFRESRLIEGYLDEKTYKTVVSMLEILLNEFKPPRGNNFSLLQRFLLDSIILKIIENLEECQSGIEGRKSYLIQESMIYIENNFTDKNLTLKKMSEDLKISQNYLGLQIKKNMGMPFNNYLNQRRLLYALTLLRETEMKEIEISERTGYTSVSYFCYQFRKYYGITPLEYREKNKAVM